MGRQHLVREHLGLHVADESLPLVGCPARCRRVLDLQQHDLLPPFGDEVDRRDSSGPADIGSIEVLGSPRVAEGDLQLAFPERRHRRTLRPSERSTARSYSDVKASAIGL